MNFTRFCVFVLLCSSCYQVVYGRAGSILNSSPSPWMTGPLLAPAGHVVLPGHTNWEPYLFVSDRYAHYGRHGQVQYTETHFSITPQLLVTQGLFQQVDFQASIPFKFNAQGGRSYEWFGDVQLIFGLQALSSNPRGLRPDLRVTVSETFPSGRYSNLNPPGRGVDGTGAGAYQTSFNAIFQKIFWLGEHALRPRLSLSYTIPSNVTVFNFNRYGGGFGTQGTVDPGNVFTFDFGLEFVLTQSWVPALDLVYTTAEKTSFSGVLGVDSQGRPAMVGSKASAQYSLAPAIEYNFSAALGIIAGAWFTVSGRDTADFASAVVAVNYYV